MIGNFLFSGRPRPDDVVVWLQIGGAHGAASARIALPADIQQLLVDRDYPPLAPSMSVESALCYGIFLAIRSKASLVIAGDKRAWNADWGYLTDLGQFPTVGLAAQTGHRTRG